MEGFKFTKLLSERLGRIPKYEMQDSAMLRKAGAATKPPYPTPAKLGSSTTTVIIKDGLSEGKKPQNEAT